MESPAPSPSAELIFIQHPGDPSCNVMQPIGDGVHDIKWVIHGPQPGDFSRWYDTYDGRQDDEPDWYALEFSEPAPINSLFFTHGPMFPEGGWWASLDLEWRDEDGIWRPAAYASTPPYDFTNARQDRRPFESHWLSFPTITPAAIRISGQPGGSLKITTLAYLAAALASPDLASAYLASLHMPEPPILRLLPPAVIWDFLLSLRRQTNILFDLQMVAGLGLDHFLDKERYAEFHAQRQLISDPGALYNLLGTREGWPIFGREILRARAVAIQTQAAQVAPHHGGMGWIVIPIVIDGEVLATIENRNLLWIDGPDADWHTQAPSRLAIDPASYARALAEIPAYPADEIQRIIALVQRYVESGFSIPALPLQERMICA